MNYYNRIKTELINNEINRKVKSYSINKADLKTYYNVGKMLSEAGKHYGDRIIQEYAKMLRNELNKKYSVRVLYKMIKYYNYVTDEKVPTLSAKLSWSHYDEILSLNDSNKIKYYIYLVEQKNLSVRQLRERVRLNEYERLDDKTKNKILNQENKSVTDLVKNPIIVKNNNNYEMISEKLLKELIIDDLENFLEELGVGFTFVKSEYKIKIENNKYNYIDLLLYNIKYRCYVVIELKITELKKEHTGQIMTYMNYIDENVKMIDENDTVGIIICKQNNKYVIKYCSDNRIIAREYELR